MKLNLPWIKHLYSMIFYTLVIYYQIPNPGICSAVVFISHENLHISELQRLLILHKHLPGPINCHRKVVLVLK